MLEMGVARAFVPLWKGSLLWAGSFAVVPQHELKDGEEIGAVNSCE